MTCSPVVPVSLVLASATSVVELSEPASEDVALDVDVLPVDVELSSAPVLSPVLEPVSPHATSRVSTVGHARRIVTILPERGRQRKLERESGRAEAPQCFLQQRHEVAPAMETALHDHSSRGACDLDIVIVRLAYERAKVPCILRAPVVVARNVCATR
jgi:hypothetical protein